MRIMSSPHDSDQIFKDQENIAQASFANLPEEDRTSSQQSSIVKPAHINALSYLDVLTETGFLVSYTGSNYGFSHPIISGYLAGNALASTGTMDLIQSQPAWNGKTLAMYYFSRVGDVTPYINALIQEDDILHTNHLKISRWLQIAPKNRQWRSTILRTLTTILTKEKETLSLSAKIISAMAFSGDVGVSVYFRQLLKSENPNLMQLAALGCGILAEKKAIDDLNTLVQDQSPTSIRAASLALAAIGDKRSLEILAANLLSGSELSQRYAAEALANNPTEGHPALKEGSSMEDLLVRRSVAFGLIRVNQPWAIKIVENMQLEDSEWVVRNAAVQAFSELQRKITYAPAPTCDPTETQWLIDYAAKVGTTVAPGEPANELVIKALVDGTDDEVLNALEYLRQKCDPETVNYIYRTYSQKTGEIKDTAYYVLWLMMIAGIKLPVSIKYNIE
jgi:HEAT repeat protein